MKRLLRNQLILSCGLLVLRSFHLGRHIGCRACSYWWWAEKRIHLEWKVK